MNAPFPFTLGLAALAGTVVLFGGCTTYRFKVDAIKDPAGSSGRSYRLIWPQATIAQDDSPFRKAAEYMKTALSSRGMFEAPPGVTPDLVVDVDFGIDAPHAVQWAVPSESPFAGGHWVTVVLYKMYLHITARDNPGQNDDHPPLERWSTYVTTENDDDDLDKYLPLLIAAAMDSMDTDTAGQTRITLRPNGERVVFVKAGM